MFCLSESDTFYLYPYPTDMRKSFYSLSGIVTNEMKRDVRDGEAFIFVNRALTSMKILHAEYGGLVIYNLKLERGCISLPDLVLDDDDAPPYHLTRWQELDAAHEREQTAMDVIENQERTIKQKNSELKTMSAHIRQLTYHNNQANGRDDMKRVCKDFDEMSDGKKRPEAEDWNRLMAVVDNENPDFAAMLHKKLKRIDDSILRTAYLLKIGMDNIHISNLMNAPRQTTWNRTKKLLSSLGDELTNT